jgi:hypothetical protein
MTNPTKAEANAGEILSKGAKTYLRSIAKERFYQYTTEIDSKYLDKGNACEQDSIDLYNSVMFTNHSKNTERKSNDFLTGECDVEADDLILDAKTSWSLETFPATEAEALQKSNSSLYEWQGRGYMMLYSKEVFRLFYAMVSTPIEQLKDWDNHSIHLVDHIAPEHRLTSITYFRDESLEADIESKCRAAIEFIENEIQLITNKNQ